MGELCRSLRDEHRVIERVLNAMTGEAVRLEAGYSINADFVRSAMTFLREYADGFHHHKEETILFPQLEQAGLPRGNSPIDDMINDHGEGQRLVAAIEDVIEAALIGDTTASARIAACMHEYVAITRRHVEQEENILFPMGEQMIQGQSRIVAEHALNAADASMSDVARRDQAWAESLGHPECPSYETERAELVLEESEVLV